MVTHKARYSIRQRFAGTLLSLALCGAGWPARAADPATVSVETLLKTSASWDGIPYQHYPTGHPELSVLKITIPPKTALPWHTHAMPNAAYVLSGELLVEKRGSGQTKRIKAGEVLSEMVGTVHRGVTGDTPVVLIVFYAGTKGMPLSAEATK